MSQQTLCTFLKENRSDKQCVAGFLYFPLQAVTDMNNLKPIVVCTLTITGTPAVMNMHKDK